MLSFDEALERILAAAVPTAVEDLPVAAASGRIVAETIRATEPLPPFDYSMMDGYALAGARLEGDGPWEIFVRGECRAGEGAPALSTGDACRIYTGAPIPDGADCVVPEETVDVQNDVIRISRRPRRGANVRRAGEDLSVGNVALDAGVRLGPAQLALVSALDRPHIRVRRRPRVVIVCTGSELRPPGSAPWPGSVPESNAVAIAEMARHAGAVVEVAPVAPDEVATVADAIRAAASTADVLVTIGGVSVGRYDVVRLALESLGGVVDFWKVRIKPGKPLLFAELGRARVLGLPGNPGSALTTFTLFGVPLLLRMQGARDARPRPRRARLTAALGSDPVRRTFARGWLEGDRVTPLANQSSGAITSTAWANSLIVVPEGAELSNGAAVEVLGLGDR